MTSKWICWSGLLACALCACVRAPEGEAASGAHNTAAAPAPTNRIELPAGVRRNLGITFAEVELRDVARTLRVPGAFELEPRARREYRMALPGRVELLVDQYQRVEPGTPLYSYRSPAWPELMHEIVLGEQSMETARAEIGVADARLQEARTQLELARRRIAALAEADFRVVELEVEAATLEASLPRLEAELELARTGLANAARTRRHALHRASAASGISEAELEAEAEPEAGGAQRLPLYLTLDRIVVRAVEGGVVEALAVTDGAFVEPPTAVLSIVDPTQVRLRALGLQADLQRIAGASSARVVPPPAPGTSADAGANATLEIGLEAHPEQRTMALIATPTEFAPWMRPGVAAFLEVVVAGRGEAALAVPRAAVVRDGLTHVVFRRDPADPDTVIRVEADLGVSDGQWVVLESGVMGGDQVVFAGAYELQLAMQQSGAGTAGGHVHAD
ncbi:MAG TPA: hypothetical protein VMT18_00830, partial [Planctomycetota bacterium]|nr:hypothetical protein [Planctomycetota bacterium]